MKEFIGGLIVLWTTATYWLGGQEIPGVRRGFKWIRRFVLPLGLLVGLVLLAPSMAWKSALACGLLCAALHRGYQEKLWKYAMVGLAFAAPALILTSANWTMLLPFVFHLGFGFASIRDNRFGWSIVALLTGASIGVTYVYAVQ